MENEKDFHEEKPIQQDVSFEENEEMIPTEETDEAAAITTAEDQTVPDAPKKSGVGKIVFISVISTVAAIALLFGMLYLVLTGAGIWERQPKETEPTEVVPDHTYTVDDATIEAMVNNVVAKAGGMELTNAELQMYYESSIISYQSTYGYYLMYMGIDSSQPLDTLIYDKTTGQTWQDVILDSGLQTWHLYAAVKQYADAAGYTPDEEGQAYLNSIDAKIQENVSATGYNSAEELVKGDISPGATVDALRNYMKMNFYYSDYVEYLEEKHKLSAEDAEQYYTENEEILAQNGISKENSDVVDVRHVLVQLDNTTSDESGQVIYTEEEWETCRVKAQGLLDQWLSGEASEDTFAQLAKDNSKDGNAAEGGLYKDVTKNYMVDTFDAWIFDESRQYGDSGLVKTPFGYHIMFFVKRDVKMVDGVPQHIVDTQKYVANNAIDKVIKEAMTTYTLETYLDQVGVSK